MGIRPPISLSDLAVAAHRLCPNDAGLKSIASVLGFRFEEPTLGLPQRPLDIVALRNSEPLPTRGDESSLPPVQGDHSEVEGADLGGTIAVEIIKHSPRDVVLPSIIQDASPLPQESVQPVAPKPRPLLRPHQARCFLWETLAQELPGNEIDCDAIVDQVSRGLVPELKLLKRKGLRSGVHIMVDEGPAMHPFRSDVRDLQRQTRNVVGSSCLRDFSFSGFPDRGLISESGKCYPQYNCPTAGTTVLLVSDLGIGRPPGQWFASSRAWAVFLKRVVKSGCRVISISPYAPYKWPKFRQLGLSIVYWGTKKPTGASISERDLARALSPAAVLNKALIREARVKMFPQADAGLEAELHFSQIVAVSNARVVSFRQDVVRELRAELTTAHADRTKVLRFLSDYRKCYPSSHRVKFEEEMVAASLNGATQTLQKTVATLIRSLIENDSDTRLARWAANICNELPSNIMEAPLCKQLRFAANVRLGIKPEAVDADGRDYGWLFPKDTKIGLRCDNGNLVISDSVQSDGTTIDVPATVPRHLMVGLPNKPLNAIQVWPGREDVVFPWVLPLDIRTLSGAHYRLKLHEAVDVVDLPPALALSPDGRKALSGAPNSSVLLWDADTGHCLHELEGHSELVTAVAWSPDMRMAVSASKDKTIRLWDVEAGRCLGVLEGHSRPVSSVAWSPDGRLFLSGSSDSTLRIWDVATFRCMRILEGHSMPILCLACSPDCLQAISCSGDATMRLWELKTGRCLRVFEGHVEGVRSVAWSQDGNRVLSGAEDNEVRLWEVASGRCLRVLKSHTTTVTTVAWAPDSRRAFSGDESGRIQVWDFSALDTTRQVPIVSGKDEVTYANAKVLLVGESSAGKTGLSMRLAENRWEPSDSTVGAWATQWPLAVDHGDGVEREIWLWDFGGQADQRLIHQLYMNETSVAVLVFDGQKEDLFDTLGQWDRDISRASRKPFKKLLVAGRIDAGGLRVSRSEFEKFAAERNFRGFLETSAKTNLGIEELKQAIIAAVDWDEIPCRTSPAQFKLLKNEIIRLKDAGRELMRFNELRETLLLRLSGEYDLVDEELRAVLTLLAAPGVVWELDFGSWVLMQPERINAYAQAVIRTLRDDPHERGCITEQRVLAGDFKYASTLARLPADEERILLLAMHQRLVNQGLCLRIHDDSETPTSPTLLVFPSFYSRERPELVGHPAVFVSYRFSGFLDDIYATLVVRLQHTDPFDSDELWRYAADFKTMKGERLGIKLTRRGDGAGELDVYFDPVISVEEKMLFSRYVHEHLMAKAQDVVRRRHYVCPHCHTPVGNLDVAMKRLHEGKADIGCLNCDDPAKRIPLWDELEERFASPELKQRVQELQAQSQLVLDNESKERALVGEVISTVVLAGQICREHSVSDHGIDMEIEFKHDDGTASGKKVYLKLKSGDSYLTERKRDGAEIFKIDKPRHVTYWMNQAFPVILVIRNSEGEVRWMEIREWLRKATENGTKKVTHIEFVAERFDVMSIRRLRDQILSAK